MSLDEKQKETLKEKYKEHRRAVWRGETSSSEKEEGFSDNSSKEPTKQNQNPEKQSVMSDRRQRISEDDDTETVIDITPDETVVEDSSGSDSETTVVDNQPKVKRTALSVNREIETPAQKRPELIKSDNKIGESKQTHSNSETEAQSELVEKIKEQRRATWAGESSLRSKSKDRTPKREVSAPEPKSKEDEPNEEKSGITWKLAIAVITGVTGAIGLGVYLGYIIASSL